MSLRALVRCLLTGERPPAWDPDADDDIKFLRAEKARAERATALLRTVRVTPQ